MKKLFVSAAMLATVLFSANAQDVSNPAPATEPIRSKRGYAILPEAGDWGLSGSAQPALQYLGNFFQGTGTSDINPFTSGGSPYVITGKKFIDANTAYRVMVGINLGTTTRTNLVHDDLNTTDPAATVSDKRTISTAAVSLGAGLEKRRGIGRLQGVYGAMARITLGQSANGQAIGSTSYTYGNSFTSTNPTPTFTNDFGTGGTTSASNSRITSNKGGFAFGVAVLGFVGVEYFIAPKISLGAEYQWGPQFTLVGKGKQETESFDGTTVTKTTAQTGGTTNFSLNTGSIGVNLNFYF